MVVYSGKDWDSDYILLDTSLAVGSVNTWIVGIWEQVAQIAEKLICNSFFQKDLLLFNLINSKNWFHIKQMMVFYFFL